MNYPGYLIQIKVLEAGFLFEPGEGHFSSQSVVQLELSGLRTLALTLGTRPAEKTHHNKWCCTGRNEPRLEGTQLKEAPY